MNTMCFKLYIFLNKQVFLELTTMAGIMGLSMGAKSLITPWKKKLKIIYRKMRIEEAKLNPALSNWKVCFKKLLYPDT